MNKHSQGRQKQRKAHCIDVDTIELHPHAHRLFPVVKIGQEKADSLHEEGAEVDDDFREALGVSAETVMGEMSSLLLARLALVKDLGGRVMAEHLGAVAAIEATARMFLERLEPAERKLVQRTAGVLCDSACVMSLSEYAAKTETRQH